MIMIIKVMITVMMTIMIMIFINGLMNLMQPKAENMQIKYIQYFKKLGV